MTKSTQKPALPKQKLTILIPADIKAELTRRQEQEGITITFTVTKALEEYFRHHPRIGSQRAMFAKE